MAIEQGEIAFLQSELLLLEVLIMRPIFLAAPLISIFFVSSPAVAATVTPVHGTLLVNAGSGYKRLIVPMEVAAGNQVMANPGGRGEIAFSDGCVLKVEPGQVVTIPNESPCVRQGQHNETGGSLKDGPMPEQRDDRRFLIHGLLIGGAVGCAILCFNDKDKPASP